MNTAYEPRRRDVHDDTITVRRALASDAAGIAQVMSTRAGDDDCLARATRLLERAPVMVVAEAGGGVVGWSGAHLIVGRRPGPDGWYVSGLTVSLAWRRHGAGLRLLTSVVESVRRLDPGATVFSIANAANRASLNLHTRVGFRQLARGPEFVGTTFDDGWGVLLAQTPGASW